VLHQNFFVAHFLHDDMLVVYFFVILDDVEQVVLNDDHLFAFFDHH
jgi:hypothetical protein